MNTIVYARNASGKLSAFKVSGAATYEEAIEATKSETGAERALCLVMDGRKTPERPTTREEAA